MTHQPETRAIRAHQATAADARAHYWDAIHQRREWGQWPPEAIVRSVCRAWAPERRSALRVLDLGSGGGAVTHFLCSAGFQVFAMDFAPAAHQRADATFGERWERNPPVRLLGDFTQDIPLETSGVDHVTDACSLSGNPFGSMQAALENCLRVLRPGGRMTSLLFAVGTTLCKPEEWDGMAEVRYLAEPAVIDLFAGFRRLSLDRVSYTTGSRTSEIVLWHVDAEK